MWKPIYEYIIKEIQKKYQIKSINFFQNFIGECSNIILFRNKKSEGLPSFFLNQHNSELKPLLSKISPLFDKVKGTDSSQGNPDLVSNPIFKYGIFSEGLFNILLKQEINDDINQNGEESSVNIKNHDIKDLLEKIIAIYIPSRYEIYNDSLYNNIYGVQKIILKDSINNLDATFNKSTFGNEKSTMINGVHVFNTPSDLEKYGGFNHLIPLIELIINPTEGLLTIENIRKFFDLISAIITPSNVNFLKEEKNSNFFFYLSFFLEKIPNSFFG